jgi:hypothetical protein
MKRSSRGYLGLSRWCPLAVLLSLSAHADEGAKPRRIEHYGNLPLTFEANAGQADASVKFISRGSGYALFLSEHAAVLGLGRRPLRMAFSGANSRARVVGLEELPGKANYLLGRDPSRWHTNVATYRKVKYEGVYPGVDLIFYGNQRRLEYDFVIAPGADPGKIVLDLTGAPRIDARGDLVVPIDAGEVRFHKPVVYQAGSDGGKHPVEGRFFLKDKRRVGFRVGRYDRSLPLVIDPVLSYSTLFGGGDFDYAGAIALDSSGNAYITGYTSSFADFPTNTDVSPHFGGSTTQFNYDAFVSKLNQDGSGYVYSTYLGGTGFDSGAGIAVDSAGNAYVTGATSSADFPLKNAFQDSLFEGVSSIFVSRLNASGSALTYSTFIGAEFGNSIGYSIAVDASGNAYVTGISRGRYPTKNGYQSNDDCRALNAFPAIVAKINTTQSGDDSFVYSTELCGPGISSGFSIAADNSGVVYVTGTTTSPSFPTKNPAFTGSANLGGSTEFGDVFITKLDTTKSGSSSLLWSTYFGGGQGEEGEAIATDGAGAVYIAGGTASRDLPISPNAFQSQTQDGFNAFVAKFDTTQSGTASYVWSSYLGGSSFDGASGVAVDPSGNVYVRGWTSSANFPTLNAPQATFGGGTSANNMTPTDAFVTKIKSDGSALLYSTYLGGSGNEDFRDDIFARGPGIAVDSSGNAYLTGATRSSDFPVSANAYFFTLQGTQDAFVAKLVEQPDFSFSAISAVTISAGSSGSTNVKVNSKDEFNQQVTLSVSGQPTGITTVLNPASVTPQVNGSASSSLGITVGPGVAPASYTLSVSGTAGSLTHSASAVVKVQVTPESIVTVIGIDQALGCIDNSGIASALTDKLAAAQAYIAAGDIKDAINTLMALLNQLQAQDGKHIKRYCLDSNGNPFDPWQTLVADVQALLASL